MDLLLDTHVLLWWDADDPQLGPEARAAIADSANRVHVSAASLWEIAIKARKGKLSLGGPLDGLIAGHGFLPLPMMPEHAIAAGSLDWDHPDPFDRMLVAQARAEALILVHADGIVRRYGGVPQLWAKAPER